MSEKNNLLSAEQKRQIEEANERIRLANEKYEAVNVNKKSKKEKLWTL